MREIQNICLIDGHHLIQHELREKGFNILALATGTERFFDLPKALADNDFTPDFVMQTETLANRTLVTGLDAVDCPTMFWAIDPHLNAYWHSAYARLFDVTCSTQRGWISRLKEQGAADVRWLPFFGRDEVWNDYAARSHDMAFVGRVSEQRPARRWMIEFLKEKAGGFDLALEDSLSYGDMMALYRDSRIIPNESIFGEVNFRLFEASSCGSLVLSQALGDEQEALFEPGREFDTYGNIVELDEKLSQYLANPRLAQTMGRAARQRVQAEHLAIHRAERILEYAQDATHNRAQGGEAAHWLTLTIVAMWEAGLMPIPTNDILQRLTSLEQNGQVAAAVLRVQSVANMTRFMTENINTILGGKLFVDSPELNLVGSMAALRLEHWDGAKAFLYRHQQATGARPSTPPADPIQLLTQWAKDLKRQDRLMRAGFAFDAEVHLPVSAAECLMSILSHSPEHLPTLRLLDTMLRPVTGLEQARVGFLSILTLHERQDWRLGFEIALANLKSYRLDSGLEELQLAREIAAAQGQESMFDRALAARDDSGLLAAKIVS